MVDSPPPLPQYPEWLQRHRESLPKEQYEKYQEQQRVMGRICEQFEAEQPTDGDPEHRARFETILDLMQQVRGHVGRVGSHAWGWGLTMPFAFQLQDLGHPPKELAGESVSARSAALSLGFDSVLPPAALASQGEGGEGGQRGHFQAAKCLIRVA